ncbi:LysM peptidoglycan-binding domain-containing protein [Paenibacillus wynnii]|uniref:LysM peptidoglycan-binding domain-containing protein n=1 Tax=Paenibacillus wynnii TaxID=268407 RepID=UPI00278F133D|nr:LysM peptidoglycan-binding domain-containing protein [Paenibacillus wynnii]MDQ0194221.1 putative chitinase [Paenibacillus wynnii]
MNHIVQPGDTMWSIAARYGVTVDSILRANNLTNPNYIYLGQNLIIPTPGGFPLPLPIPSPGPQPGAGLVRRVERLERQYTVIEAELDRQIQRINRLEQRVRRLEQ